ncbi:hypothetical protein MPER_01001 [Moniliophthora perniciosa FA553]|nr:hypothetical protein MPER_01001 [Moniliophthora perniciosa FA553]
MSSAAARALKLSNGIEIPIVGLGTWAPAEGTAREDAKEWLLTGLKAIVILMARICMVLKYFGRHGKGDFEAIKASGLKREEFLLPPRFWLLHWPQTLAYEEGVITPQNPDGTLKTVDYPTFVEVWAEMEKAFEQGKCKAIGVSNFSIKK